MADMRHDDEWRWWCAGCTELTDTAPCEHCGRGHDDVRVLPPGTDPPTTEAEIDALGSVDDYAEDNE
jgi:predicted RNA-binding protein with PUA domain